MALSACAICTFICWEAINAITEPVDCVYCCLCVIEMPPLIVNPADCEVRAVIRFLSAKDMKAAEIHRQISEGEVVKAL